jgi:uncharacterized protein DUF1841
MSPKRRGRPKSARPRVRPSSLHRSGAPAADEAGEYQPESDCWFDEPEPGDRRSWAVPPAHGSYKGLDLELVDPGDEHERGLLIEALHPEFAAALEGDHEVTVGRETVNPRLHVTLHQVVANQLVAGEPPETWQAVQRLAGLGYDWHNIMHMIAALVGDDIYRALHERRRSDSADYIRRLSELPGDWPPPEPTRLTKCGRMPDAEPPT